MYDMFNAYSNSLGDLGTYGDKADARHAVERGSSDGFGFVYKRNDLDEIVDSEYRDSAGWHPAGVR